MNGYTEIAKTKNSTVNSSMKKNMRKRFVICAATGKEPRGLPEYIQKEFIDRCSEVDTKVVAVAQDNSVRSCKVRYKWDVFVRGLDAMIEFIRNDIVPVAHADPKYVNVVIIVDGWTNLALLIALFNVLIENSVKFSASPMDRSRAEWLWIYWCPEPKGKQKKAKNGGS
jgi:hypothetical protein